MTNESYIRRYLTDEPRGRYRRHKDRAIVNILLKRFVVLQDIPKETLTEFVKEYTSLDRAWRLVISTTPEWQMEDYGDKDALEVLKQKELGYQIS